MSKIFARFAFVAAIMCTLCICVPGAIADEPQPPQTKAVEEKAPVNEYDAEKAQKLQDNLAEKFEKGGEDSALNNMQFEAAIALDSLGCSESIDAQGIIDQLSKSQASDPYFSAGTLSKYIAALSAAGVDCTSVDINGEKKNLIADMEAMIEKNGTGGIWSEVNILPVYAFDGYVSKEGLVNELKDNILSAQDESGLFGASGEGWSDYSTQTTAQAILALTPYRDEDKVSSALKRAVDVILSLQNPDGSFAYSMNPPQPWEDLINSNSYVITALNALGFDCTGKDKRVVTANGSTPLGYLINMADVTLDGYDENGYDGINDCAAVLMALAAQRGETIMDGPYNVYSGPIVVSAEVSETTIGASETTIDASDASKSPKTGDDGSAIVFSAMMLVSLCGAFMARRQVRRG